MKTFKPKTKRELQCEVFAAINANGPRADLNYIDTSEITDMSFVFVNVDEFNGDISKWDVSNVRDISYMFCDATSFDCDISKWDVSKVEKHVSAFKNSKIEESAKVWFPELFV